jgi:hypothetical protein
MYQFWYQPLQNNKLAQSFIRCENWCEALRKECRLMVLGRAHGLEGKKEWENGGNRIMRSCIQLCRALAMVHDYLKQPPLLDLVHHPNL